MGGPHDQKTAPAATGLQKSGAWADLGLTLPVFVGYHIGVGFLPYRNAADVVTRELVALANHDVMAYVGLTTAIGLLFVGVLVLLGRGQALRWERFLWVILEGVTYAITMRLIAAYVVGRLRLAGAPEVDRWTAVVLSLGAGLYEEIAFRVVLYGLGARVLSLLMLAQTSATKEVLLRIGWAVVAAAVFSGWHHVGTLADPFEVRVFVFRWVCGLVFTAIYALRGFAPVVWTHTLYDLWVLAL
ncbi:MAG: CPBP family intramembrane metalloprotease [Polyangiaceae bacterium]|nr:CPBP family intramembrane metalloprotease [Polyangiaceae bacterium]